jgi:hypothetical protein
VDIAVYTIDVCILTQAKLNQNVDVGLRTQSMEDLGDISGCLNFNSDRHCVRGLILLMLLLLRIAK